MSTYFTRHGTLITYIYSLFIEIMNIKVNGCELLLPLYSDSMLRSENYAGNEADEDEYCTMVTEDSHKCILYKILYDATIPLRHMTCMLRI